jgi:hypothetical protein
VGPTAGLDVLERQEKTILISVRILTSGVPRIFFGGEGGGGLRQEFLRGGFNKLS